MFPGFDSRAIPRPGGLGFRLSLLFLVLFPFLSQAETISAAHGGTIVPLRIIRVNGIVYVSVQSLAQITGNRMESSGEAASIVTENGRAEFRRESPFVWTTRNGVRILLQLPLAPAFRADSLYLPIGGAVRILQTITKTILVYDPARERLTIGALTSAPEVRAAPHPKSKVIVRDTSAIASSVPPAPKPTRRDSVQSILLEARANGILVGIDATPRIPRDLRVDLIDAHHAAFVLGAVLCDTNNVKNYASKGINELYFARTEDSLTLHVIVVDSIEAFTRQAGKGHAAISLRTSRATAMTPQQRAARERWKMDIVVLDAGHGGKDPGAQGVGGTNEKDVTLGVVLKLGKLLEKAGIKVEYTRKTDDFVELFRRGQIANEAKGKLFISIHCNSMPTKPSPANGFESYILRPGKNETAVRVAARENNVIGLEEHRERYGAATEESFIVAAMAQSGFVRYSERFATLVQEELARHCAGAKNNGVSQAGFLVLVGASMPNILIETGYVSNPREERVLASMAGQQHIAEGIAAAVKRYQSSYERGMAR